MFLLHNEVNQPNAYLPTHLGHHRTLSWDSCAVQQVPTSYSCVKCVCMCVCSCSVMSDSLRPHGLQPTRLLRPWDFPGKSTGAAREVKIPIFIIPIIIPKCQSSSPNSSHSPLPLCPLICFLCLCLSSCPRNRFICTIFLDSTYMR